MANLYYCQPILYKIADTFDVSFEKSSIVATLLQAGYATGIVLLIPLGDVFRRRPYILLLVMFTATLVRTTSPPNGHYRKITLNAVRHNSGLHYVSPHRSKSLQASPSSAA